jgi:ADP-heptose:LPS heptosyltransferase
MGNTHKRKRSGADRKLALLFENMGVDNIDDILAGGNKALESFGQSMNKALGVGKKAANTLNEMQTRDATKELESIGVKIGDFSKIHDTLAEFEDSQTAFICCASTHTQTLCLYDGSKIDMNPGDEVCMTASAFIGHVRQAPTLKLTDNTFAKRYRPYKGQDLNGKTLFVWRSGGIGDLMFIRPVLMAFKEKYDVEIIFATRERYHSMVEQWDDCIDQLSNVPFFTEETLDKADYHITFEGLIERCRAAEELDVHDLFARHSYITVKDYNRPMKCVCKNTAFDLLPQEYAVMQLGSSSPIRTPLFGHMVKVADHITENAMLVVSGSPRESRNIDDFISCCKHPQKMINFARFTGSVVDAIKLVTGSSLVVGPDSSHVHMAAAQGISCVGIYGPFDWKTRCLHYKRFKAVEPRESAVCEHGGKHCFIHSHLPCHYQTKCWNYLDAQEVIDAIEEVTK